MSFGHGQHNIHAAHHPVPAEAGEPAEGAYLDLAPGCSQKGAFLVLTN